MTWNPAIPPERRFETTMRTVGRPVPAPTHVVLHITGDENFNNVRQAFLTQERSAHYVIDKQGVIFQFVKEEDQAWHAGIRQEVRRLYQQPNLCWRRYLYYFNWYTGYPSHAVYADANLNDLGGPSGAARFVRRGDGEAWPHYDYFTARWGPNAGPVHFETSPSPNAYSVGIEVLSIGSRMPSHNHYTEAMYGTLRALVADICGRYAIPMTKGRVLGHEDVTPVQRFGWDPNQGFDWSRVWA